MSAAATSASSPARSRVVTGASRGIGRAIADALRRRRRARRHLQPRRRAAGERGSPTPSSDRAGAPSAPRSSGCAADVARFADARHLHAAVDKALGVPDILVNNAGLVARAPLDETSRSRVGRRLDANLKGTFIVTRVFSAADARARGRAASSTSRRSAGRQGTRAAHRLLRGQARRRRADPRARRGDARRRHPGQRHLPRLGRHRHARRAPGFPPRMSPDDVAGVALYLAADAPPALTGSVHRRLRLISRCPSPRACRSSRCRRVQLFPHALLPLHVFEPRYRDMVRDAMAGERLIASPRSSPATRRNYQGRPAVRPIIGVGAIVGHEPLGDGRANIVLRGLARARIERELPPAESLSHGRSRPHRRRRRRRLRQRRRARHAHPAGRSARAQAARPAARPCASWRARSRISARSSTS